MLCFYCARARARVCVYVCRFNWLGATPKKGGGSNKATGNGALRGGGGGGGAGYPGGNGGGGAGGPPKKGGGAAGKAGFKLVSRADLKMDMTGRMLKLLWPDDGSWWDGQVRLHTHTHARTQKGIVLHSVCQACAYFSLPARA